MNDKKSDSNQQEPQPTPRDRNREISQHLASDKRFKGKGVEKKG